MFELGHVVLLADLEGEQKNGYTYLDLHLVPRDGLVLELDR